MFGNDISNEEFNARLEFLAKLVERKAKDATDAARLIRMAKITDDNDSTYADFSLETENLAMPEIRVRKK